jgi:hypothetical protein
MSLAKITKKKIWEYEQFDFFLAKFIQFVFIPEPT